MKLQKLGFVLCVDVEVVLWCFADKNHLYSCPQVFTEINIKKIQLGVALLACINCLCPYEERTQGIPNDIGKSFKLYFQFLKHRLISRVPSLLVFPRARVQTATIYISRLSDIQMHSSAQRAAGKTCSSTFEEFCNAFF